MDRARLTGLGIAAALAVLCALLLVRPDEEGEQAPTPPPYPLGRTTRSRTARPTPPRR